MTSRLRWSPSGRQPGRTDRLALMQDQGARPGLFSVFGYTRRDGEWLTGFFKDRIGVNPAIDTCPGHSLRFLYSNQGQTQQTGTSTYLALGFVRSADGQPLGLDEDCERKLTPDDFEIGSVSGNGYLVRFRNSEPAFTVFPTFMATSQVYYMPWEGGILCATDLRVLLRLAGEVAINEDALPLHLMFRIAPGPNTHFKGIARVFPGEILDWRDGALKVKHLRDTYCPPERPIYDHLDRSQCQGYMGSLSRIMASYVHAIEGRNGRVGNELSGGVDSAVIQLLIGRTAAASESSRSFSLVWEAPGFQFEVDYARQASEALGTQHTFLGMRDRDYAALLVRAVETLAQPNIKAENDPGQLALAEHIAANHPGLHVFMGMGGDATHGVDLDSIEGAMGSNWRRRLPGRYAITESARLFGTPIFRKELAGVPDAVRYAFMPASYRCLRRPACCRDPVNTCGLPYTTIETLRHFLGDRTIQDGLEYRRSLVERALTSHNRVEQVHDTGTVAAAYNTSVSFETLFAAAGVVLIPFYYDQDVIRLVKSVSPEVRYVRDGEEKPILKDILRESGAGRIIHEKKGSSGFWRDFQSWMMTGTLREMVHSMDRPAFIGQHDWKRLIENRHPYGYDLVFPLLTYDIFKKNVASRCGS